MTIEREHPLGATDDPVLVAHDHIRELTRRLQAANDLVELLGRVAELRSVIVPHFAAEEAPGGLFNQIRARSNRHHGRLHLLEEEHAALLGEFDALAQGARDCLAGPVAEVLRRAGDIARRLASHERLENRLFMDAHYTDVGETG